MTLDGHRVIKINVNEQHVRTMVEITMIGIEDRSLVIGIMSMIHLLLKKVVQKAFVNENTSIEKDTLLKPGACLAEFSDTLEAAYRLDKIPKQIFLDLKILNKIRNRFAHNIMIDFDDRKIIDYMSNLNILKINEQPNGRAKDIKKILAEMGINGNIRDFIFVAAWITISISQSADVALYGIREILVLATKQWNKSIQELYQKFAENIKKSMTLIQ